MPRTLWISPSSMHSSRHLMRFQCLNFGLSNSIIKHKVDAYRKAKDGRAATIGIDSYQIEQGSEEQCASNTWEELIDYTSLLTFRSEVLAQSIPPRYCWHTVSSLPCSIWYESIPKKSCLSIFCFPVCIHLVLDDAVIQSKVKALKSH